MSDQAPPRLKQSLDAELTDAERAELFGYANDQPAHEVQLRMLARLEQVLASGEGSAAASGGAGAKPWRVLGGVSILLVAGAVLWALSSARVAPAPSRPPVHAAPLATQLVREEASPAQQATTPALERESSALQDVPPPEPGAQRAAKRAPVPPELALLVQARRELPVHPAQTLALAERHARHYPHGALEEEREVLAIEALLKLSRSGEARRRISGFLRRFPKSSQRATLTGWLEGAGTAP